MKQFDFVVWPLTEIEHFSNTVQISKCFYIPNNSLVFFHALSFVAFLG